MENTIPISMNSPRPSRFSFRSTLAAALVACAAVSPVVALHAQEVSSLALPERRALKEYQEKKFPDLQKNINAAAKFDVPLDVQWGAIAQKDQGSSYLEDDYFTNVYFVPLANALKQVTSDAMGADALKSKLKKVVITFDEATAPASNYPNGVKFENGTLTINFMPFTNAGDVEARSKAIASGLEAKL